MPKIAIVVINGLPRSGKDTVADQLLRAATRYDIDAFKYTSVQHVYDILNAVGVAAHPDMPKSPKLRALMSELKASFDKFDDYSTKHLIRRIVLASRNSDPALFTVFIREPEAIERFYNAAVEHFGGRDMLFHTAIVTGRGEHVGSNASDDMNNILRYPYTMQIINGGTLDDLRIGVAKAFETFLLPHLRGTKQ